MHNIYRWLIALMVSAVSCTALAVDVVDQSKDSPEVQLQKVHQQNAQMRLQMEELRKELMSLRGSVETLEYELNKVKTMQQQQQQAVPSVADDTDFDAADTATLSADDPASSVGQNSATDTTSSAPTTEPKLSDLASYQQAFDALKKKQYPDAESKFKTYLQHYPQGEFAANAHYWLGEIYLLDNKASEASTAFQSVVDKFSQDSKADDARYKLAEIYTRTGEKEKAKSLLQTLMNSSSASERVKDLATALWNKHYSS